MRSVVKVAALSMVALLIACSGSESSEGAAANGGEKAAANDPQSADGTNKKNDDEAAAINALVAGAGHLTTDKKADPEPVKTSDSTKETVTGDSAEYQCTYTNYSLTKVPEKFVALNPNADVLWPGSLVQGKSMAGGILDPIPVKRAPGTITLTLASGSGGPFHKTMEVASLSAALEAENEILSKYDGATPAKFSYSFQSIYSSEQLSVAVDANVKGTNWSAAASLSIDKKDEKSRFLIQFSQEFYTMAFDPPQGAAGVFDPSVTAKDLAPYAQDGNPPVYISGVTYGRIFYILFESKSSQLDLEAAVKGSYSGPSISVDASLKAKWQTTVNESTVKAYGLGGNAELAIGAVVGNDQFEKIQKFLTTGANFDKQNPGVPISYTIRHLTDASQVKLALTTEYTAKDCTPTAQFCDKDGHKLDKCGVCGGNGTTCDGCSPGTVSKTAGNGAYVNFNVGDSLQHNQEVAFADGNYYKYGTKNGDVLPLCHRITWGNVRIVCKDGSLQLSGSQGFSDDHYCTNDSNASWSSGQNSISTGWKP